MHLSEQGILSILGGLAFLAYFMLPGMWREWLQHKEIMKGLRKPDEEDSDSE